MSLPDMGLSAELTKSKAYGRKFVFSSVKGFLVCGLMGIDSSYADQLSAPLPFVS
jgi:hypothetical protein